MKTRNLFPVMILALALASCNMPGQPTPELVFPTPNATLTALFATSEGEIPPTVTPDKPKIATATPEGEHSGSEEESTATHEAEAEGEAGGGTEATPTPAHAVATATSSSGVPVVTGQPVSTAMATSTPAPTTSGSKTSTPTATASSSRSSVTATYLTKAPTIDGDWSEWKDSGAKENSASSVVYGAGYWTGEADLSASYYVGWDDKNLYVAFKVRDDTYVQGTSGNYLFMGDSIDILLDTDLSGDLNSRTLSADDYQLGISPGRPDVNGTREAYLWFPSNKMGTVSGVTIGAIKEDGVYRVEAAIPWSVFGVTPSNGARYGFAVGVSDNDAAGQNVQQSMVSNTAKRYLADPTTWAELVLSK